MIEQVTITNAFIALVIGVLSLAVSYRALLTSRTPQGAVGWIFLILLLPLFGTLIYLVFGHANYKRFERERNLSDELLFVDAIYEPPKPEVLGRLTPFARIA